MRVLSETVKELFRGWTLPQLLWLSFCQVSLLVLSVLWEDSLVAVIAAQTGMLYTILAGKGKAGCFLFGIVNTPLYAYLSFDQGYYGDFALNIYYFAMMFWGMRAWLMNRSLSPEEGIVRSRLAVGGRVVLLLVCAVSTAVLALVLREIGGTRPVCDALTNVLSIAAMYLTVRRAIEQWVLWIAVNAIEVFMWTEVFLSGEGMISVLLMWMIFLLNGIYILWGWMRLERNSPQ